MHWQFGGNLEPVQMICELDWKECPKAIANYIWNEVVTDVLDCLNNDGTVWRILAVLLACTMLLRIICYRTKEFIETSVDKELINKIGYKMEDLELKVNILTYKMQYGSWPLPHQVQKSNFRKQLRNLRLTMSSPNDRNNWIKHVLLSPRRNESYASYPRYDYRSTHRLTELFDAKKKLVYPYLRQECLPMERSSKSSKSSSDKSLKLNSIFKRTTNRKRREVSRDEHLEMQYRNAISLPLFSRNKNNTSGSKLGKDSKRFKSKVITGACKNFVKTMDECKRYLKELHDSNKNLGLVCSSSNFSDESSIKDCWPKTQQQKCDSKKYLPNEVTEKPNRKEEETDPKKTDTRQENCTKLSSAVCPVLKLSDRRIIPSKMNVTFYADMFPRQSVSNILIPEPCDRTKFIKTSQEALYRVKKKLESLHNVLRTYEIQNVEATASGTLQGCNDKVNNVCRNVVKTIVSATTEADKWNEGKKSRVNFDTDTRKNSSEHYESDDTTKSSMRSIQSYSNVFGACQSKSKVYPSITAQSNLIYDNRIGYSSSNKYEKVPERVYYAISSDSEEGKNVKEETTNFESIPDMYIDKNQEFPDQYPVPMETDEDVMITSPTSSHTEVSKDSESEEKSTALLLQEALQFKKALLTRVELENVNYTDDERVETNAQPVAECGKYSYVSNNLQSKFLDIISEEQSVSSSTDKTSRTYMFYNVKQNEELPQKHELCSNACKGYLDSKHDLNSPSEYFSFTNIIEEENGDNNNQLPFFKQNYSQQNVCKEMIPNNMRIKCFNDSSRETNVKLAKMTNASCFNVSDTNMNEQNTCYENEALEKHLLRLNNRNELINQSVHSVELYSENLDEAPSDEANQNSSVDMTSSFLNCKQYTTVSYNEKANDSITNDEKYVKDNGIPNLNLRRHPGACSLIKQTLVTPNIEKEAETNTMLENESTMYDLSFTDSKETSIETNLIQDSLTSSINQSNDFNIPEPPSATVLINKSLDEDKSNFDWLNDNAKFSDGCINETDIKRSSTNTIILKKYDTANTDNCTERETVCNNYAATVNEYKATEVCQSDHFKGEKRNPIVDNSFVSLGKESLNNETDQYKSYSTLISPHSSLYFTDEASSSTTKLNNSNSRNLEHLHSNLSIQKRNEEKVCRKYEDSEDIKKIETILNENKKMITGSNEESCKQQLSNSESNRYDENGSPFKGNCMKNINVLETGKTKQVFIKEIEKVNDEPSTLHTDDGKNINIVSKSMNVTPNKIEPGSLICSIERLNANQYFSSRTSPRDISLRESNPNKATKKTNVTLKSKSQENYTPKSEKVKKPGFTSGPLNDDQIKTESNKRVRDFSVKSRRTTENEIKLDRKRSRSQTCFRTNESSKQVVSRESPRSTMNYTQSLENRSRLSDHLKCLTPTPKISSKSCIPILKSRLEAARRSENEARPKSPMRGPLTMTMFWKDNLCDKNDAIDDVQAEGKSGGNDQYVEESICVEKSYGDNNHTDTMKSSNTVKNTIENIGGNIGQQEQMVIYINIFTKYDQNTTKIVDPNKFLEYIKNRESKIQKLEESQRDAENEIRGVDENSKMQKIVTVVSSVINGDELDQTAAKAQSKFNILTNDKLRNLCFLSVEQREIDVTAKPSVIDTSTSISDLENISGTSESALSKFQICGIPRELNNEEYVTLLEILHQEANFVHLQELQSVCNKLVSDHFKSK